MASTLEHAYSSPDGSAERLAPPPGASRASRASLASSPPSILARVSLEGFLYKQQGAHPMHSPQSTRGFLGLAGRFWCVIRSDVDVFAAYTKYQDTLVVNGHAAAFHCTDMTVEEPQDEPSCFVLRGKDLRGAEQTLELYAADEAERQGWAKELRRHGARRYVAPPPVDTMTQLREATARKAKEAAAGVKEAATDTAAALRWAGESAAVTLGAKSPTAEEQKDHLMTLKQQRAEKRDGQVTTFTTTPPKSYRPAAVVDRMLADWTERALEGIGVYVFNSLKDPWLGTVKARPWWRHSSWPPEAAASSCVLELSDVFAASGPCPSHIDPCHMLTPTQVHAQVDDACHRRGARHNVGGLRARGARHTHATHATDATRVRLRPSTMAD